VSASNDNYLAIASLAFKNIARLRLTLFYFKSSHCSLLIMLSLGCDFLQFAHFVASYFAASMPINWYVSLFYCYRDFTILS